MYNTKSRRLNIIIIVLSIIELLYYAFALFVTFFNDSEDISYIHLSMMFNAGSVIMTLIFLLSMKNKAANYFFGAALLISFAANLIIVINLFGGIINSSRSRGNEKDIYYLVFEIISVIILAFMATDAFLKHRFIKAMPAAAAILFIINILSSIVMALIVLESSSYMPQLYSAFDSGLAKTYIISFYASQIAMIVMPLLHYFIIFVIYNRIVGLSKQQIEANAEIENKMERVKQLYASGKISQVQFDLAMRELNERIEK